MNLKVYVISGREVGPGVAAPGLLAPERRARAGLCRRRGRFRPAPAAMTFPCPPSAAPAGGGAFSHPVSPELASALRRALQTLPQAPGRFAVAVSGGAYSGEYLAFTLPNR